MNKLTLTLCAALAAAAAACTSGDKTAETAATNSSDAVLECIMTRASVRQFSDKAVSKETLDTLVRAGMAAPTAVNKQPWAFVVISDKAVLDSLNAVHPHANLETATAAISVCGDLTRALEGKNQEYWIQDCSAATENILLAAHAMGLGAVWCGVYPNDDRIADVSRVLQLPDSIVPLNIITLGYPAGENAPKDKWDAEKVHYQKW